MFAFLAPFWLITIPFVAGLLVFAYLRHGRNKQNKISSLYFIKQVAPSIVSGRRRMSLPWRLLFELLVLLALISALSGMFLKNSSQRAILIIDNSLSMGALLNPSESKETLLDEAKRSAKSNLELFSDIQLASIWITSPVPHQITNGFISSVEARDKISEISPSFSSGNISALLSRLTENAAKVLIFTDQLILPQEQAANPGFSVVPLNALNPKRGNIALENISIDRSIDQSSTQIVVKARSFLNNEASCRISVARYGNNSWSPFATRDVNFSGFGTREIIFALGIASDSKLPDAFKAQIVSCNSEKANSLTLDDKVWMATSQGQSGIIIISEFTVQQLGLDKISGQKIESMKPKEWADAALQNNNSSDKGQILIFHRFVPKTVPLSNSLFIAPPEGPNFLKVSKLEPNSHLIRWEDSGGLLRYLSVPDLELKDAVKFNNPPVWTNALMYSTNGPVAIYGQLAQRRYVALGFEILPFEGKANPFLSILTLDLVKWLSNKDNEQDSSNLLKISANKAKEANILDSIVPDLRSATITPNGDFVSLTSPGLVEVISQNGSNTYALNFFSASESNLLEPGFVSLPKVKAEESNSSSKGLALEVYLIILALAVLMLDSFIFLYKRSDTKRRSNAL